MEHRGTIGAVRCLSSTEDVNAISRSSMPAEDKVQELVRLWDEGCAARLMHPNDSKWNDLVILKIVQSLSDTMEESYIAREQLQRSGAICEITDGTLSIINHTRSINHVGIGLYSLARLLMEDMPQEAYILSVMIMNDALRRDASARTISYVMSSLAYCRDDRIVNKWIEALCTDAMAQWYDSRCLDGSVRGKQWYSADDLAMLTRSLARLGARDRGRMYFKLLESRAPKLSKFSSARGFAAGLSAMSEAGFHAPNLMSKVHRVARANKYGLTPAVAAELSVAVAKQGGGGLHTRNWVALHEAVLGGWAGRDVPVVGMKTSMENLIDVIWGTFVAGKGAGKLTLRLDEMLLAGGSEGGNWGPLGESWDGLALEGGNSGFVVRGDSLRRLGEVIMFYEVEGPSRVERYPRGRLRKLWHECTAKCELERAMKAKEENELETLDEAFALIGRRPSEQEKEEGPHREIFEVLNAINFDVEWDVPGGGVYNGPGEGFATVPVAHRATGRLAVMVEVGEGECDGVWRYKRDLLGDKLGWTVIVVRKEEWEDRVSAPWSRADPAGDGAGPGEEPGIIFREDLVLDLLKDKLRPHGIDLGGTSWAAKAKMSRGVEGSIRNLFGLSKAGEKR